jgi:5-methylcytosine-specific restriction endonuclease McrA
MASPAVLYRLIADRDRHRCAYCLTTEENCGPQMHVDHIVPEAARGTSTTDNLCQACFSRNVHKAAQQSGTDPVTGEIVPLFHPRRQRWIEHFA